MKKEPPAIEVRWNDAHGGNIEGNGWGTLSKKVHHKPEPVRSVGILFHRDETGITIALSLERDQADCYLFVPAPCIVAVRELG